MPIREKWKEVKIIKMLNVTVFYTDGFKSATRAGFRIYEVNRLSCKIAATLEINATVYQSEFIAINTTFIVLLEKN